MPGLTPKQEAFAQAYVETGNATEAYKRAGYSQKSLPKTINEAASRLLADCKISTRVKELQEAAAKRHALTVDDIARMLAEDRDFARELEKPSAAVAASMGLAKLYGHMSDKVLHGNDPANPMPNLFQVTLVKPKEG